MNFRIEYAEKVLQQLTAQVRNEANSEPFWCVNIHVSKFWHFSIQYEFSATGETIMIRHKRRGYTLRVENGVMTKCNGIRRFDMLFAALHHELIPKLSDNKTFKITRKKLNERYLMSSPYFWSKIDYYLFKKETQMFLHELFGDEKYRIRAVRIQRAIDGYIENKRNFIEDTRKKARC